MYFVEINKDSTWRWIDLSASCWGAFAILLLKQLSIITVLKHLGSVGIIIMDKLIGNSG